MKAWSPRDFYLANAREYYGVPPSTWGLSYWLTHSISWQQQSFVDCHVF